MLYEAREEPVGQHHISQSPASLASEVRSQSFPRSRFQGSGAYSRFDTQHIAMIDQNHAKVPVTKNWLETAFNKMQKDIQYLKSHVKFCGSSESLPSQHPEECSEDCNNLSPGECSSDLTRRL